MTTTEALLLSVISTTSVAHRGGNDSRTVPYPLCSRAVTTIAVKIDVTTTMLLVTLLTDPPTTMTAAKGG